MIILGNLVAENDFMMLDRAFCETDAYKILSEENHLSIVVGRRGTGKSALVHKLKTKHNKKSKARCLVLTLTEDQVIGMRHILPYYGDKYSSIKAACKIIWRYSILMEISSELGKYYKTQEHIKNNVLLREHLLKWEKSSNFVSKMRSKLKSLNNNEKHAEERVADLVDDLELERIEKTLIQIVEHKHSPEILILLDKLDDGYQSDELGIAFIGGLVNAIIEANQINSISKKVKIYSFIRDSVFRAIRLKDENFSRDIEGGFIRLQWSEHTLLRLVANRLRVAFNCDIENDMRVWNKYSAYDMEKMEGFKKALKLTLYRPRDILSLLNTAYMKAQSSGRSEIIFNDIDESAKEISMTRYEDLIKEYKSIFPTLELFTTLFSNKQAKFTYDELDKIIRPTLNENYKEQTKGFIQDLKIHNSTSSVIQRLYSVGFIGMYNKKTSTYIFSHDGKDPEQEICADMKALIHPCYWLALIISDSPLTRENAELINDEYDIKVDTEDQNKIRLKNIEKLVQKFKEIETGKKDAYEFEDFSHQLISLLFAKDLANIELHPNGNCTNRRDIICTNYESNTFWKRLRSDYKTRQVLFEIKNYSSLAKSDYVQVSNYLSQDYGSLAFIICRSENNEMRKSNELAWARQIYSDHKKIIIKISANFLIKQANKLRNANKHDEITNQMNKLLDLYIRSYLSS